MADKRKKATKAKLAKDKMAYNKPKNSGAQRSHTS